MTLNQIKFFALAVRRMYVRCAFTDHECNEGGHDLEGHCEWVSYALLVLLRDQGVKAELCYGDFKHRAYGRTTTDGHFWLRLPEHKVYLDISATQFGKFPAVYVWPTRRGRRRYELVDCGVKAENDAEKDNFIAKEVIKKFRRRYGRVLHPVGAGLGTAA